MSQSGEENLQGEAVGRGGGRVVGWGAVRGGRVAVRCGWGWGLSLGASYRQAGPFFRGLLFTLLEFCFHNLCRSG